MVIKRTVGRGVYEFELTDHELFLAYQEQEHAFDLESVRDFFSAFEDNYFLDQYGMTCEEILAKKAEDIACEMRRQINKYGVEEEYALYEAIDEVLDKRGAPA